MPKKKTHEEFLKDIKGLIGDEYEVLGKYITSSIKVKMKHSKCGLEYDVTPNNFVNKGRRCPKCSCGARKNTKTFKEEVFNLVGNEYEVLGDYVSSGLKIKLRHNICNREYMVSPNKFLQGNRCPECFGKYKKTTKQYKKEVFDLVSDEYEVLGEYIGAKAKIKMKHNECGREYCVSPDNFLRGAKCPLCKENKINRRKTHEQFCKEVYDLVGNEYIVIDNYIESRIKISIKHSVCGNVYKVRPQDFLYNSRCPKCNESKGEKNIRVLLEKYQVAHDTQYKFDDCRYKKPLPFDFVVFNSDTSVNCLIEYDGEQHYIPVEHWGGEEGLKQRQHNDQIKNQYCKNNNIKLIRIPYWNFDNIEDILNDELKDLIGSEICTEQAS